ncbi:Permease of the drug/metabolite transporter (DMT) superfamily [Chitinophaga niabensis]|uniref:Permease of the drug/metabolite transporter (DMT) superfamily n=2 Tax=Chitinophaga niabensis TaxID=536979 RepID=A0A1N6FCL2_9BACT|nr:Permease of the drug/metabolite transporter (DMT) superfamily [Chitinophaga niabensis]
MGIYPLQFIINRIERSIMKKSNTSAYLALIIVSFFWGTTYLASRIGVQHMHGIMLAGLRQTAAGVILVGFFMLRGYKLPELPILSRLFVIGVLMLCGSNGLMTWAMQYIPSGMGAIIAATVPIWITIFSYFLVQKTRISIQLVLGMVIGMVGIGGIFYDHLKELMNPEYRLGVILIVVACVFWALGSVLTAKWALGVNYLYGAGFQMLFSGLVMLLIAVVTGQHLQSSSFTGELWGSLLYLIFIGSLLGYSAYVFALNNLPPSLVSIYAYVNPIVAVVLGWLILSEKLNWTIGASCLVTLFGVYLVNNAFNKNKSYERSK